MIHTHTHARTHACKQASTQACTAACVLLNAIIFHVPGTSQQGGGHASGWPQAGGTTTTGNSWQQAGGVTSSTHNIVFEKIRPPGGGSSWAGHGNTSKGAAARAAAEEAKGHPSSGWSSRGSGQQRAGVGGQAGNNEAWRAGGVSFDDGKEGDGRPQREPGWGGSRGGAWSASSGWQSASAASSQQQQQQQQRGGTGGSRQSRSANRGSRSSSKQGSSSSSSSTRRRGSPFGYTWSAADFGGWEEDEPWEDRCEAFTRDGRVKSCGKDRCKALGKGHLLRRVSSFCSWGAGLAYC
eukprot:772789-Pelagomonas_calceolata.AAC.1